MKSRGDNDGQRGRRVARVEAEVMRLVADYLIRHGRGELPCIVTVSRVQMPADFHQARVYVSLLNHEGKAKPVLATLQSWAPNIQRHIGDSLRMRNCPRLTFFEDEMTAKVLKVEGMLEEISRVQRAANPESNPGGEDDTKDDNQDDNQEDS